MRMRITSVGEQQLAECIKHSVWGSKRKFFNWEIGDLLVICVNKEIAAVAEITGEQVISGEIIWENDLFPFRVPLSFTHLFAPNHRLPVKGEISESFYNNYGEKYGYVFLNKMLIKPEIAELTITKINSSKFNLIK